jgi:hypothetical protein
MPSTYPVAWWNLENLFDEENSPRRTEKLQRTIGADLAGLDSGSTRPKDLPARVGHRPDERWSRP